MKRATTEAVRVKRKFQRGSVRVAVVVRSDDGNVATGEARDVSAGGMKLTTRDGRHFEKTIFDRRGSPENPLKPEDIEYKFRHVVRACVAARDIDRVIALVQKLEKSDSTRELIEIVAAPGSAA